MEAGLFRDAVNRLIPGGQELFDFADADIQHKFAEADIQLLLHQGAEVAGAEIDIFGDHGKVQVFRKMLPYILEGSKDSLGSKLLFRKQLAPPFSARRITSSHWLSNSSKS